jgi:hypothetical protein
MRISMLTGRPDQTSGPVGLFILGINDELAF